jgi:hypothetical protein
MSGGPHRIGSNLGSFFYTGRREAFEVLREVVTPFIGTGTHCREELGYAAALDFAHLGAFTGVMTVLGNVFSLLDAEGIRVDDFLPTVAFLSRDFLEGIIRALAADQYPSGTRRSPRDLPPTCRTPQLGGSHGRAMSTKSERPTRRRSRYPKEFRRDTVALVLDQTARSPRWRGSSASSNRRSAQLGPSGKGRAR